MLSLSWQTDGLMEKPYIYGSDPISFSVVADRNNTTNDTEFDAVQSRSLEVWQDESVILKCNTCHTQMSMGNRHHCRRCGRLFCSKCCNDRCTIPSFVTKLPKPTGKHKHEKRSDELVLVCKGCFKRLNKLNEMGDLHNMSSESSLHIDNLLHLSNHSKDALQRQWANFKLSTFREIQYYLVDHKFTDDERALLWANRKMLVGHSGFFLQLLRSFDYEKSTSKELAELQRLLQESQQNTDEWNEKKCWKLMCARTCKVHMDVDCVVQLLNQNVRHNAIREYAIYYLNKLSEPIILNLIRYLVRHSLYSISLQRWILDKCSLSESIANKVFWTLQEYLDYEQFQNTNYLGGATPKPYDQSKTFEMAQEILHQWKQRVPQEVRDKMVSSVEFVHALRKGYKNPEGPENIGKMFATMRDHTFLIPTKTEVGPLFVDHENVKVMGSINAPVKIPLLVNRNGNSETESEDIGASLVSTRGTTPLSALPLSVLYKPVDIRKESVCMDTICMMKHILFVDEGLELPIVCYPIYPCSFQDGLIEMVPECVTLDELRSKGVDILAFLIEKNERSSEPASVLRERFLESCAAYCIITFLLGVCDRHLDNIMLRFDGCLFHIDYGFVLGQDPKPLKTPVMRISREMLAVLGGVDSEAYKRFKVLCSRIYNCLRRHVNLFVCMLRLLSESDPMITENGVIDDEMLMTEIRRRFVPGETHVEAEILLYNQMDHSTSSSFANDLLDRFHTLAKVSYSSYIPRGVSSFAKSWWATKKETDDKK